MTTAVIGTGRLGSAIFRTLRSRGRTVLLASRRPVMDESVSIGEAIERASLIVLAVPHAEAPDFLFHHRLALRWKIVVDATNNLQTPSPGPSTLLLARLVPESILVKTLNATPVQAFGRQEGEPNGMGYCLDDCSREAPVRSLIRDLGFVPVFVGGLAQSALLEPGTPLFNTLWSPERILEFVYQPQPVLSR